MEEAVPTELEWVRQSGEHAEAILTLKTDVASLRSELRSARDDITEIKLMLASNRGGVKMLLAVGGSAAALGAALSTILRWAFVR